MKAKHFIGKRNLILVAVALILVVVTAVGTSVSWIEEVSQVEFSSDDGQQTPHHIGNNILKSDMTIQNSRSVANSEIQLKEYFNESGAMHLSPCYSDGDNFYFPVENQSNKYRVGTKDDANVNYLSATFRVKSEGASTVYWFEKSEGKSSYVTFKKGASTNTNLQQALRCSVTVDGSTSVYALNSTGEFYTVENNVPTRKSGRIMDEYAYYQEQFNADKTSNTTANNAFANQGPDKNNKNLNGNTLFSVNAYDLATRTGVKTVTVKLWLEYQEGGVAAADLSDINLNLVSSWAKMRRIYIKDETIDEIDNGNSTGAHWLTTQNTPTLHWALQDNVSVHFEKDGNAGNAQLQYFDIPAVYSNTPVYMCRCNNGWNQGSRTLNGVTCWDQYTTTFPNSYHSETYTVYTKIFGTWDSVARHVEIINSCQFNGSPYNNENQFTQPFAYMWDSSTDIPGQSDRVVQNSTWPGVRMTRLNQSKDGLGIYAFYYNSIFDRIIFNDNYNPKDSAYQTEDINLDKAKSDPQYYNGKIYDMATMKWYNSTNNLPTYSGYSVYGDFYNSTNNHRYTVSRMVVNPSNSQEVYCRVYVRYPNSDNQYYYFKIMKNDKSQYLGWGIDGNHYVINDNMPDPDNKPVLSEKYNNKDTEDLALHASNPSGKSHPGIYGIYFNTSTNQLWVQRES